MMVWSSDGGAWPRKCANDATNWLPNASADNQSSCLAIAINPSRPSSSPLGLVASDTPSE